MTLYLTILIEILYVVKQWTSMCSISSTTLPSWTFASKYGCFVVFVPWGKNLSNCLVLGVSWLRPMSNNTKHTPWDSGLVTWVSKVLCLIPNLSSSLGFAPWKNLVYARESQCVAVPILPGTEQLWTLLVYLSSQSSSLSAANLVCLSGEELGHHCNCSSSLSAADLMLLLGEELVHRCHHVSVQINTMLVCCACCRFSLYCPLLGTGTSTGGCTSVGVDIGWARKCSYGAAALLLQVAAALTYTAEALALAHIH